VAKRLARVYTKRSILVEWSIKMMIEPVSKMSAQTRAIFFALDCILKPSGYRPSVGEVSKIAGVSYGVADRHLQKLCRMDLVRCLKPTHGRVRYRFMLTSKGVQYSMGGIY
jgi:DNA-binding MarR family transcriptional regulator